MQKILIWVILLITAGLIGATFSIIGIALGAKISPAITSLVVIVAMAGIRTYEKNHQSENSLRNAVIGMVACAVGFGVAFFVIRNLRSPESPEMAFAKVESSIPLLASLKLKEPALYEQIKATSINSVKAHESQEETMNEVRSLISQYAIKKLPYVSDDILMAQERVDLAEMEDMQQKAPEKCVAAALGRPMGDIQPYLQPKTIEADSDAMDNLVRADRLDHPNVASANEVAGPLNQIVVRESARLGMDKASLLKALSGNGDLQTVCNVSIEFTRRLIALPQAHSAAIFRYLMAQQ